MIPPVFLALSLLASAVLGEVPMNPEREKLLKDALGWMTFRKNGKLATDADLEPLFFAPLKQKYLTSQFYRSFVIAFEQGVLPRLTLKEGDPCSPGDDSKDLLNNSVTWHFQKQFTFQLYDDRVKDINLCDYREGLVCKSLTSTCQCPEDSSMQPIEPGSSVKRCLVDSDKVCNLIDLDHGNDPQHSALASNLYHLLFNLEKPLSCAPGTQCRFKGTSLNYPKCYDVNGGPFSPSTSKDLGEECALGLYSSPDPCKVASNSEHPGYVCYNFGPPRSLRPGSPGYETRIGFCAHEYGAYGILGDRTSNGGQFEFFPLFTPFVHPRTVPLRGDKLRQFYSRIKSVSRRFLRGEVQEDKGGRCSTSKTTQMEEAWQFFASLEKDPPPGQDYVEDATEAKLEANLQIVEKVGDSTDLKKKVCQVYWRSYRFDLTDSARMEGSTKCAATPSPDADGNDGVCQEPGNIENEYFAKKTQYLVDVVSESSKENKRQEASARADILEHYPELPCDPTLGPLPAEQGRSMDPEALEGARCPQGAVCYQDFSDALGVYDYIPEEPSGSGGDDYEIEIIYTYDDDDRRQLRDFEECQLNPKFKQVLICHDTSEKLGVCEKHSLKKKVSQAVGKIDEYGQLKMGEACYPEFEKAVIELDKEAVEKIGYYQLLNWLDRGILCNRKEGLECGDERTCQGCKGGKCKEAEGVKRKREREQAKGKAGAEVVTGSKITLFVIITATLVKCFSDNL